jgi:hypothetical protein
MSGQLYASAVLHPVIQNSSLGGPNSRAEIFGEEKNLLPQRGIVSPNSVPDEHLKNFSFLFSVRFFVPKPRRLQSIRISCHVVISVSSGNSVCVVIGIWPSIRSSFDSLYSVGPRRFQTYVPDLKIPNLFPCTNPDSYIYIYWYICVGRVGLSFWRTVVDYAVFLPALKKDAHRSVEYCSALSQTVRSRTTVR